MKKHYLLRMAFAGFLLAGLSLFTQTQTLHAQTQIDQGIFSVPQGQFVSGPDAMVRLEGAMPALKDQVSSNQPGTPIYREVFSKLAMYEKVRDDIGEGKGVAQAIADGVMMISTDEYNITRTALLQHRTAIINLLRI